VKDVRPMEYRCASGVVVRRPTSAQAACEAHPDRVKDKAPEPAHVPETAWIKRSTEIRADTSVAPRQ
jgi:hypothetical protein